MLLHLIDGTSDDVAGAYRTVREELLAYGGGLEDKTEIVALNKCDALDETERNERRDMLAEEAGTDVLCLSGVSGEGVEGALRQLHGVIRSEREERSDTPATAARPWNL